MTLISTGCGGEGATAQVLEVAVTVDYAATDSTLFFRPGNVEMVSPGWASHTVDFEIATDDWVQHVSLHDSYVVEESQLVPAKGGRGAGLHPF